MTPINYLYSPHKETLEPQLPPMPHITNTSNDFSFEYETSCETQEEWERNHPSHHAPKSLWGLVERVVEEGEFTTEEQGLFIDRYPNGDHKGIKTLVEVAIPIEKERKAQREYAYGSGASKEVANKARAFPARKYYKEEWEPSVWESLPYKYVESYTPPQPVNLQELLEEILKERWDTYLEMNLQPIARNWVVNVSHIKEVFSRYGIEPLKAD